MQVFAYGIINGLAIALLALAFAVVYLSTRVFFVALGAVYAVAPFIVWGCLRWGWPWYSAGLVAVAAGILLALIMEVANHAPLDRKKASSTAHFVTSLGIYIFVIQVIVLMWGNETKVLRTGLDYVWTLGGIVLTRSQIWSASVSVALLLVFCVWLFFTNIGLRFRALADNPVELAIRGHNVRRLRLVAFGVSGLLGASSAILTSLDIGFNPQIGLPAVLLAAVAVIVGGKESFLGPVLGGILLGLVRTEAVFVLSARWQEGLTFLILTFFLFARPMGLVGRQTRPDSIL